MLSGWGGRLSWEVVSFFFYELDWDLGFCCLEFRSGRRMDGGACINRVSKYQSMSTQNKVKEYSRVMCPRPVMDSTSGAYSLVGVEKISLKKYFPYIYHISTPIISNLNLPSAGFWPEKTT